MHEAPKLGGDFHHFIDAEATFEAGVVTLPASRTLSEWTTDFVRKLGVGQLLLGGEILRRAVRADRTRQSLRDDAVERTREQVRFDPHVQQPGHSAWRVVR